VLLLALLAAIALLPVQPLAEFSPPAQLVVVTDDNYPPYLFRTAEGQLQGILKDKWALWSGKTGVPVQLEGMVWAKAQGSVQAKTADVIDTLSYTEARTRLYEYSPSYATIEARVFFHLTISGINDVASMRGFTIGAKDGSACASWLAERGIEAIRWYPNSEVLVQAAGAGEVRLFCMDTPSAQYFLFKQHLADEFRQTPPLYSARLHWAVAKGRTDLRDFIQTGFERMTAEELRDIDARWIGSPLKLPIDTRYFYYLAFLVATILAAVALLILWNRTLHLRVSARTAELNGQKQVLELTITERKQQQDRIARLNRIYAMLSSINSAIVRIRKRQALLEEACRIAVEHGNFGIAWIGSFDPATLDVTPVAWAGLGAKEYLGNTKSTARGDVPQGQGAVGRAIRELRPVFSNDISTETGVGSVRRAEALRRGYRSLIVLPLIVEGAAVGNLSLFAKEINFFDDEEVKLMAELAGNISYSLEHIARQEKFEKLSRIRAVSSDINAAIVRIREPTALLEETCRIASQDGKFEMVWIGTLHPDKQEVRAVAWTGFSAETAHAVSWASISAAKGTLGEAIRTRKPTIRNDIEAELPAGKLRQEALQRGCLSTICMPLEVEGKVVALIVLFATGRGFFDEGELAHLGELASNISFALESIARQEKIERLSRIRSVLGEINVAIVRIRTKQQLFEEACRILAEAGRFPFAWLGVVDRDARQIKPVAWAGEERGFLGTMQSRRSLDETTPQGRGPAATAVLEKKAVVVNDIQNDRRILRKPEHLERNIHSQAMLPLLVADEAVGVLALHAREVGFFDEEELKLLFELAGDIAYALQTIEKQEKLDYLSYYDPLTGLPNRTLFIDRTGQQMRARGGEPLMVALVLLNLERFRYINESFGWQGGDELLKLVAQRLEIAFHGKDYLARIGADGFGVVIRGIRDAAAVVHIVEGQILGCFHEPYGLNGSDLRVAAKAGIAMFPADGSNADTLFKNAEAALKKARDSGEHYLFYAADMNARAAQALSLETRLRKAVEARQFVLHYQPKIELASDTICGLEALIRWQEPGGELVAPGAFIPLLEETGLILEVGKWALARALVDHREWTARGCKVPRIAVNVSAIQLQQKDFSDMVINVVQEQGGGPDALELEVTESLLMKDVEGSIRKLSILRGLGVHVAMDDFGTGYSSLAYIARLPINSVKIDRSFINGMANSPQDMAIVTTIIALAHSLNLRVVAEGVETESQSKLLKLLKCDEAQGYLFSKPIPALEIERLLLTLPPEAWGRGTKVGHKAQAAP